MAAIVAIDLPTEYSLAPPRVGFLLNQCYNSSISTYSMSEEQLKAFLEKVQSDTNLQEKLKAAADSDAVLAIVKDAGFSISADDLTKAQSKLSEEELEGVAGGIAYCAMNGNVSQAEWAGRGFASLIEHAINGYHERPICMGGVM